ncbi:UDP-2,4-diacetamido-2,4, 6-trideoxy-beta-L-altropyranose hydrolase [Anaerolineales bacterium]|nr:UDP-2,4-diacetamido-2,4, 6-trideoxy-beta-L-altropyranose hydrolase [Anaerolineales bacterium]
MNVVFRVDASSRMGIGHFMRCLTLAETLRERGAQIRFVCREHKGNLIALLQQKAMPVTVLPAPAINDTTSGEDYAAWLGVTQAEDAKQTIEALNGEKPDWLVVDHYGLDVEWEQRLRPHVSKLMVIDDLANRRHDCDVLLDQNYSAEGEQRYAGLVPGACKLLVGPRYALLRPEYVAHRKTLRVRDGQVRRVLVFFGGTDQQNVTGMALEALSYPDLRHLKVDVVVGANNPHRDSIEQQVLRRPHTTLHASRPHLADLMAQADLALGAGGATTWERMCLGLPSIVISIAENQRPASEALAEARLIHYAGHFPDIKTDHLTQLLMRQSHATEKLAELSTNNQLQVDGLGTLRLVEVLCPCNINEIRLRPACEEDIFLFYHWANDPEVRKKAVNTAPIPWVTHRAWFTNKLRDVNSRLFVLEAADLSVGQIRLDKNGDEARIDYSLDVIVQGRIWAPRLVALGSDLMQKIEPVRLRASVKARDEATSAVFLRMGFTETISTLGEGTRRSIAILSDRASWMNEYIQELLLDWLIAGHRVLWVHDKQDLRPGDFCFYLSCGQIMHSDILSQFRHNLVVHESDLPRGKGWSPLTWQILEGKNRIPATLFEAAEKVDSGVIYAQEWMEFEGHELIDELREAQAKATIKLCKRFVDGYPQILGEAREQVGESDYYPRRLPNDSFINPEKSISELFAQLRVADSDRYPSFFNKFNHMYKISLEKYIK